LGAQITCAVEKNKPDGLLVIVASWQHGRADDAARQKVRRTTLRKLGFYKKQA
jgi:hypothetical protein